MTIIGQNELYGIQINRRIHHLAALRDNPLRELLDEEWDELQALLAFREDVPGTVWSPEAIFIRDRYFTDHIRTRCDGMAPEELLGLLVIDWEATAEALKVDYGATALGNHTYYWRKQ